METLKKKVVLLGDSAVGKTSIVRRFVVDRFDDSYITTLGVKVMKKTVDIDVNREEYRIVMSIWDVLGDKGFQASHARHICGADCALLVSDLSRLETFDSLLDYWIPLLYDVTSGTLPPLMFAGNKVDLLTNAEVPTEEEFIKELRETEPCTDMLDRLTNILIGWCPTSAKTGENIEECFRQIARMLVYSYKLSDRNVDEVMMSIERLVVDQIVQKREIDTGKALADIIIADAIMLAPTTASLDFIEESFRKGMGRSREFTPKVMEAVIKSCSDGLVDAGVDLDQVKDVYKKWLSTLNDLKRKKV